MILVTGATGFLGVHLTEHLREKGYAVSAPKHNVYDLTEMEAVRKMLRTYRAECIIHLAARVGGIGANRENPATFFYDNLMMGVQLLHTAWLTKVKKVVLVGTVCSYPKYTDVPFRESELWNGYPEETNAPYGLAKKALLVMAQAYRSQYGMNVIYLIPTNLYGPGDHFDLESGHVIPAIIRKCVEAKEREEHEVVLWGDGSPTREFLHVRDAARGITMAMEKYDKLLPVNLGSGDEVSIMCLAQLISAATHFNGQFRWDKQRPNGQPRRRVSTIRAEKEFGFRAKIPLGEGIKETVAWYLANRGRDD